MTEATGRPETALPGLAVPALEAWFGDELGAVRPLHAARLGEGRSNLTYRVGDAAGRTWVLRRPPLGQVLATANDVLREGVVMAGVHGAGLPVPAVERVCEDPAVTGAPFIVLADVGGLVLRSPAAASAVAPGARLRVGDELVDTLAWLHSLDPEGLGLAALVRPGAYLERQLRRWRRQWEATAADRRDGLDDVVNWLAAHQPAQQRAALVHGDPKLDNCVVDDAGRLLALLDWELSAVGDPLADLAMLLAYWAQPDDERYALQHPPTAVPGFRTRAELVDRYAARSDLDLSELPYYLTFTYWKLACIVAGVHRRLVEAALGADGPDPAPFDRQVTRLGELARASAAGALPA